MSCYNLTKDCHKKPNKKCPFMLCKDCCLGYQCSVSSHSGPIKTISFEGDIYVGQINSKGEPHGEGVIKSSDDHSIIYSGLMRNGDRYYTTRYNFIEEVKERTATGYKTIYVSKSVDLYL